jgi:hypothetical protein
MSKKIMIIVIVIIVALVSIFGLVFYFTKDATKAADNFFSLLKSGDINGAYDSTSSVFKQNTSTEQFKTFTENPSISKFSSVFWNSRSVNTSGATLQGSFKTTDGNTLPIDVVLVKENGKWKILSVSIKSGVSTQENKIPSDSELIKLTNDTVLSFANAIKNEDFSVFYSSISELWKNEITSEKLKEIFKSFIEAKADLTVVKEITPVFSNKPAIGENGELLLSGYYPYKGTTLNFELTYVFENPNWKLAGIKISTK